MLLCSDCMLWIFEEDTKRSDARPTGPSGGKR